MINKKELQEEVDELTQDSQQIRKDVIAWEDVNGKEFEAVKARLEQLSEEKGKLDTTETVIRGTLNTKRRELNLIIAEEARLKALEDAEKATTVKETE